jgi:3-methyl-2-oxobutanoate hydroxymethyltransferase
MSSPTAEGKALTARDFVLRKQKKEPLVIVSAYDALFARLSEEGGVDAILVGDSLGNVVAGYDSTVPVTLDQMIYHTAAVRRGVRRTMVIIDMPFLTYQVSAEQALVNGAKAMQGSLAHALKLEGAGEEVERAVRALSRNGIPVMGHLGYTPQSANALGGARVQGREPAARQRVLDDARRLEDAGAFGIVLELVPSDLAREVTAALTVPTIGIGAGAGCDGQVLVLLDLLGLNDSFRPRFLKRYATLADTVRGAVRQFGAEVREHTFPGEEHGF